MKGKIKLSQAMIVKNEEKNIERALSWGKGIVYEQIVVDTGSTDRTVELAESMGAKVYHFDWIDDFSAAKNFAIEKCSGNWIAFLDADEYFSREDAKKIPDYIRSTDESGGEGIFTMLINLDDQGNVGTSASHIRIFKKVDGLRYQRRIHEQLRHSDGHNIKVLDATQELTIWHTGYAGESGREKQNNNRNLNLILKDIEDNPDNFEMYIHLGNEYYERERFKEAEDAYKKYIDHLPEEIKGTDADAANAFLYHFYCLLQQEREVQTLVDAYNYAVIRIKENADIPYIMGRCLFDAGLYDESCQCLQESVRRLEKFGTLNKSQLAMQNINYIYEMLSEGSLRCADLKSAVRYASSIISVNKFSVKGLYLLLSAFKGDGKSPVPVKDVISYLSKIYNFSYEKDREFVKATADAAGYKDIFGEL
ncbi:glycosyltransferase family 2 protein [Oribacterium sp. WCC10]|uniref:glycosyltransferase family 2 protein n=1 Tax=Oribacterium sp. WCC10 TaxID=1855343 RepID=UPI0008E01CC5|nr:glycosyltransferase family 2 protein [Oribacterium sp. WCC10]SFG24197.1 Glycosyl transferase family 2 [Oribacterium sp. WCC10]